jgi:hypothetical protein
MIWQGYHNNGFKLNNDDSYLLLRSRLTMTIEPTPWLKVSTEVQDARPFIPETARRRWLPVR